MDTDHTDAWVFDSAASSWSDTISFDENELEELEPDELDELELDDDDDADETELHSSSEESISPVSRLIALTF